jgi:hypothetical protein
MFSIFAPFHPEAWPTTSESGQLGDLSLLQERAVASSCDGQFAARAEVRRQVLAQVVAEARRRGEVAQQLKPKAAFEINDP